MRAQARIGKVEPSQRVTATGPTPSKKNEAKKRIKMWAEWRGGGSRSEAGKEDKCPKSCQSEGARIGDLEGGRRVARSAVQNLARGSMEDCVCQARTRSN